METFEVTAISKDEKVLVLHLDDERFAKVYFANDDEYIYSESSLKVVNMTPIMSNDVLEILTQNELNEKLASFGLVSNDLLSNITE